MNGTKLPEPSFKQIGSGGSLFRADGRSRFWGALIRALESNTITHLSIRYSSTDKTFSFREDFGFSDMWSNQSEEQDVKARFLIALKINTSLKGLALISSDFGETFPQVLGALIKHPTLEALDLSYYKENFNTACVESLASILGENRLRVFNLCAVYFSPEDTIKILDSMRKNTSIIFSSIRECSSNDFMLQAKDIMFRKTESQLYRLFDLFENQYNDETEGVVKALLNDPKRNKLTEEHLLQANERGDTLLHYKAPLAISSLLLPLCRTTRVFDIKNAAGKTVLDLAKEREKKPLILAIEKAYEALPTPTDDRCKILPPPVPSVPLEPKKPEFKRDTIKLKEISVKLTQQINGRRWNLFSWVFRSYEAKRKALTALRDQLDNIDALQSGQTVGDVINAWKTESVLSVLNTHRNRFFQEKRAIKTNTESLIDEIERTYGNYTVK